MDVTPTKKMFEVMTIMVDQFVGEAPLAIEKTTVAEQRREARQLAFDVLHRLVHLAMREGAARAMDPSRTPLGALKMPTPAEIMGTRGKD